eukprot:TRINITY_DN9795_c0_g1_i2.p1 TRINITY_DN9795_c0_g1~~TRINITY_DN9795_c0_g1_i2.p1  ORF type:complete len:205 (-),score=33.14 TRINITY_DN9795_c0_g1_i2:80-694(-)
MMKNYSQYKPFVRLQSERVLPKKGDNFEVLLEVEQQVPSYCCRSIKAYDCCNMFNTCSDNPCCGGSNGCSQCCDSLCTFCCQLQCTSCCCAKIDLELEKRSHIYIFSNRVEMTSATGHTIFRGVSVTDNTQVHYYDQPYFNTITVGRPEGFICSCGPSNSVYIGRPGCAGMCTSGFLALENIKEPEKVAELIADARKKCLEGMK